MMVIIMSHGDGDGMKGGFSKYVNKHNFVAPLWDKSRTLQD